MANREFTNQLYALNKRSVMLSAQVGFGASGAPTLSAANSKGILSVTRQSAGIFTFQFGSTSNGVNLLDTYVGMAGFYPSFNVVNSGNASPAAEAYAIYQNKVSNGGGGLIAPVQATPVASAGGAFASGAYKWVVTATDTAGNETVASNEQSLSPTANQQVTISWTASAGASSYNVYRTLISGAAGSEQVIVGSTTGLSLIDAGTLATAGTPNPATYGFLKPPLALASLTIVFLASTTPTDPAVGEVLHIGFYLWDSNAP
jgi:hypothetical protein